MGEPFLAEIRIITFNYAPRGWAFCNGQLLPINQNQALFSILGTTYGGNGQTNFALPDLRGRTPIHWGSQFSLGERAGQESHTVTLAEMPAHNHMVSASNLPPNRESGGFPTTTGSVNGYSLSPTAALHPGTISSVGGSQPHMNMQPFLVLNFIIALIGIFPSRN